MPLLQNDADDVRQRQYSLITSQNATAPKHEFVKRYHELSLITSQNATAPKLVSSPSSGRS